MGAKILIVDDEPVQTTFLAHALAHEGYEVAVAHDAQEGLRRAHDFEPDLALLDVLMPGMDGWGMLVRLREFSTIPVIMLTAMGGVEDKVHGLNIGADDYITKPFEMEELKARIRAILRRATSPLSDASSHLSFDGDRLVIDPSSYRAISQGKAVDLTPIEHKLLLYLARNAGRVMTYAQILENVWGPGYEDSVTNVKVYVRRLRQKIEVEPSEPRYILTRWGIGYFMAQV